MSCLGVQVDQTDGKAAGSALKEDVQLSLGLACVGGCRGQRACPAPAHREAPAWGYNKT